MRMKIIAVKLPDDLFRELDLFAMNNWLSRSDVVREALEYYLRGNCINVRRGR
jgi:metal-responsive CopG/Arc/MetJ family transcriptional regulator